MSAIKAQIQVHNRQRRKKLDFIVPGFENYNPSDDPSAIGDTIIPNGLNWNYDNTGAAQTFKGYTLMMSGMPAGTDNMFMLETTTLRQLIVTTTDGRVYRYNNAGGYVLIGGPYTTGSLWNAVQFQNVLYLVNGVDGIFSWDGTTWAAVTVTGYAAIKPQYIIARKNRLYYVEKNSILVWFSDPLTPATVQSNSFVRFNDNDGSVINGLSTDVDNVVVGKGRTLYIMIGEPLTAGATTYVGNLQIRKVNADSGVVSQKTFATVRGGVKVFASENNIYMLQNYSTTPIASDLQQIFKFDMHPNYKNLMWAVYNPLEMKYILGYVSNAASAPDKAIVIDFSQPKVRYSILDDIPASCGIQYKVTNTATTLIGDASRGLVYQMFAGYVHIAGDNGTATSGTTTTLTDSTKSWTTNQYKYCKVKILTGTGNGQFAYVTGNTATALTLDRTLTTAPDATSVYTIGAYDSFIDTKQFDFEDPSMTKKYKYLNVFTNTEQNYNLLIGIAYGKTGLTYNAAANLNSTSWLYEADNSANGWVWGSTSLQWGSPSSLYLQVGMGGNDRFVQARFGTQAANQPWRISEYSFTYKEKKARPN